MDTESNTHSQALLLSDTCVIQHSSLDYSQHATWVTTFQRQHIHWLLSGYNESFMLQKMP